MVELKREVKYSANNVVKLDKDNLYSLFENILLNILDGGRHAREFIKFGLSDAMGKNLKKFYDIVFPEFTEDSNNILTFIGTCIHIAIQHEAKQYGFDGEVPVRLYFSELLDKYGMDKSVFNGYEKILEKIYFESDVDMFNMISGILIDIKTTSKKSYDIEHAIHQLNMYMEGLNVNDSFVFAMSLYDKFKHPKKAFDIVRIEKDEVKIKEVLSSMLELFGAILKKDPSGLKCTVKYCMNCPYKLFCPEFIKEISENIPYKLIGTENTQNVYYLSPSKYENLILDMLKYGVIKRMGKDMYQFLMGYKDYLNLKYGDLTKKMVMNIDRQIQKYNK